MTACLYFVVSLILTSATARIHEQACSKFDYEEKLLEKLVRMEYKMDNLEERFKELETAISSKLNSFEVDDAERESSAKDALVSTETKMLEKLTKEISDRKTEIKDLQDDFKNQLRIVEESRTQTPISFMAQLSTNVENLNKGDRIKYDDVITNEGNAYNNVQGTFSAPLNGIYNFNVIASAAPSSAGHSLHLYIMKNGLQTAYIFLDMNHTYWLRRSTDITIKLATGDQVWVEVGHAGNPNTIGGCCFHNHFSGFLIGAL